MQNVGTLGIHARHTQHSPPGLIRAGRRDLKVVLNFMNVPVLFIWNSVQLRRTVQLQMVMQSYRTRCQQVSAGLCILDFYKFWFWFHKAYLTQSWCQHWCLQPCDSGRKMYAQICFIETAILHNLNLEESSQTCKRTNLSSANNSLQGMESQLGKIQK